jgi:hypothetical protein
MIYENPDYNEMFPQALIDSLEETKLASWADEVVPAAIAWAKETLKKHDKIVWYLRWFKLALLAEVGKRRARAQAIAAQSYDEFMTIGFEDARRVYNRKTKGNAIPEERIATIGGYVALLPLTDIRWMQAIPTSSGSEWSTIFNFRDVLNHYMSLNLAVIEDLEFGWLLPNEVVSLLQDVETEMKRNIRGRIPVHVAERFGAGYETWMDFGDGYYWINTHADSVPDERYITRQMAADPNEEDQSVTGHCSTCSQADEEALVLRELKHSPNGDYWRPVLHFCLNTKTKMLGEMKGVSNTSPKPEYYKYIIPLLFDARIEGVVGGGYLPDTNFSVLDLDAETQRRIRNEKPLLYTISEYVINFGLDDSVRDRLTFTETNGTELEVSKGEVLYDMGTFEDVIEEFGSDAAKMIVELLRGDQIVEDLYEVLVDSSELADAVANLPEELEAKLEALDWEYEDELLAIVTGAWFDAASYGTEVALNKLLHADMFDDYFDVSAVLSTADDSETVEDLRVLLTSQGLRASAPNLDDYCTLVFDQDALIHAAFHHLDEGFGDGRIYMEDIRPMSGEIGPDRLDCTGFDEDTFASIIANEIADIEVEEDDDEE